MGTSPRGAGRGKPRRDLKGRRVWIAALQKRWKGVLPELLYLPSNNG